MDKNNSGAVCGDVPETPLIQMQDFLVRQPAFTGEPTTADFYLEVARRLAVRMSKCNFSVSLNPSVLKRMALNLTDYLQDIVADGGMWRSFVDANRKCMAVRFLSIQPVSSMWTMNSTSRMCAPCVVFSCHAL